MYNQLKLSIMSYIEKTETKPFTLWDFNSNTKFSLRSANNLYKFVGILLNEVICGGEEKETKISVTIWESLRGNGRHTITINEVSSKIDAKDLLIEIANKFSTQSFSKEECYIEVSNGIIF